VQASDQKYYHAIRYVGVIGVTLDDIGTKGGDLGKNLRESFDFKAIEATQSEECIFE
jgi:hypothetical protein